MTNKTPSSDARLEEETNLWLLGTRTNCRWFESNWPIFKRQHYQCDKAKKFRTVLERLQKQGNNKRLRVGANFEVWMANFLRLSFIEGRWRLWRLKRSLLMNSSSETVFRECHFQWNGLTEKIWRSHSLGSSGGLQTLANWMRKR